MTTELFLRDANLARVLPVDDYLQAFCSARWNDVGEWWVEMPSSCPAALALTFHHGLIFQRNDLVLLSGPVRWMRTEHDGKTEVTKAGGPCDNFLLAARRALPAPLAASQSGATYDVHTGAAETVLRALVDRNLGPSAVAERRVSDLTLAADGLRGSSVTARARYHSLLALLQQTALAGDVGFRIVDTGGARQFQVYLSTDRAASAVFGFDRHNLNSYTYGLVGPEANAIYGGGAGEKDLRSVGYVTSTSSISEFGRVEGFHDVRNAADQAEIDNALLAELTERQFESTLKIAPVDTDGLAFGVDYFLGDNVSIRLAPVGDGPAAVLTHPIRQVDLTLSPEDGEVLTPLAATDGAHVIKVPLLSLIRGLSRRVTNLEVR